MNKYFLATLVTVLLIPLVALFAAKEIRKDDVADYELEVARLEARIATLENTEYWLDKTIQEKRVDSGLARYMVTFKISQSHFALDTSNVLKDKMNAITIQIPVDKEYYNSVNVGDVINDDFRMGSLVMTGSIGSWNIQVVDKSVQ